jgi:GAF domain-containing protein
MFTDSDEIILEALSRVSQGALANAQSHERNIQEIQKALNNHKYYTALLAVAQELSAVLDTDTLVRKIMTKAQSFIGADRCSLFLVDHVRGGIWSMVAHGTNDRIYVPIGAGIAGTVVATGETLNIPDAYKDPRFNSAVDKSTGYRTRSILCVPIHSGRGDIIGCTQMINKLGAPQFSTTDVELMTAFNVFCGIALSNAQLFETATQSKKKMTAMLDIALSLSSSTTLDAIVTNIMGRAQELIEAEFCWLFVNDRARHMARPLAAKSKAATEFSLKQDAVGYVTLTGSELNLTNPNDDPRFDCFFSGLMKIQVKSILVIPVINANGQIIGAVKAVNKKLVPKFTVEDQSLFRAFASFAGLALEQWLTKRPADFGHAEIDFFETLSPSELTSCEPSDRMRIFDPMLSLINSQKFDVYSCTRNDEFRILVHFFEKYGLLQHFHITLGILLHFLEAAYNEYDNIPFHNWNCAVSSTQLLFWELTALSGAVQWEKVELLGLLVAGICHDCGHHHRRIVANEKAAFPLSLLYGDAPVLESFQCASAVKLLSDPKCNILASMEREDVAEFWSILIECILATDRARHKKLLDEAKKQLRAGDGACDTVSRSGRLLLMKLLMKSATVAPVARALDLKAPWSTFLIEEAVPKVDTSADEGLGAATKEIDAKGIAAAQVKFMDDFCMPLFDTVGRMVQPLQVVSERVRANLAIWKGFLEG